MTTAPSDALDALRNVLQQTGREPREHARELRAARCALAGDGELGRELLTAEGDWLLASAAAAPGLATDAREAAVALREFHLRCVLTGPAPDAEVLLELAQYEGERRAAGDAEAADAAARAVAERVAAVTDTGAALQEADERYAAQTAIDDGRGLREQTEVLAATGRALLLLGRARGDRRLARRGRRSLRAAQDRELVLRLERLLGRRGVAAVETTSFVLLLVVLVVLVLESMVALTPGQLLIVHWIDAVACLFFVAEFATKLALAPHRGSWFLRNALTDLLPAIPAVLFLLPVPEVSPAAGGEAAAVRLLRLFRITWAARYVQAMRPVLRLFRLLLIVVRGMDGLVRRFGPLLDRNFVFFENTGRERVTVAEQRDLGHAALQLEQILCSTLPPQQRAEELRERLAAVTVAASTQVAVWPVRSPQAASKRDVPVDEVAEFLWSLQPREICDWLTASDLRALDRVTRVLHARPLRWLPILRRFAVHPLPPTPEERVVALGHRVAEWLQGWQSRLQFVADLHGIVTGPQILDRVASAMVKASQRPAVRLLLFGGLFLIVDLVVQNETLSRGLRRIVVGPLLILGSFCLVTLTIGWWLKRVAGEASETFRLTSEAHFLALLELAKRRFEAEDVRFLARRVFGSALPPERAERLLRDQLASARAGVPVRADDAAPVLRHVANRTALLYLHFLDGAILHETDVTTTEQLLANSSLENLRLAQLRVTRKDRKKLRQLRLDDGSIFRGPFLWFRFITESVAVETAKRITEYNRRCMPLAARSRATPEQLAALDAWLQKRCDRKAGRTLERLPPPDAGSLYLTTEFNALDFVACEPERDEHVREVFGDAVLAALRADRRTMIREIFGMRPVHLEPRHRRSFNAWRFYWSRLSHGRVLLAPLYSVLRVLRTFAWFVGKIRRIVREVLVPHLEMQQRQPGEAPFAVALRKIHRMKAPQLLEAMRLRVLLDPVYGGAAPGWSGPPAGADPLALPAASGAATQLERDCDFLHLRERERADLRRLAAQNRERVAMLHALLPLLPSIAPRERHGVETRDGELAVTVAWLCDRDDVRTLLLAESWRADRCAELAGAAPAGRIRRASWWLRDRVSLHPAARWCARHAPAASPGLRHALRARYDAGGDTCTVVDAWNRLPPDRSPGEVAIERLRRCWLDGGEVRREIAALRAVQSLSVLDVRNYRDLVFRLGGYAEDGEDPALATDLPRGF